MGFSGDGWLARLTEKGHVLALSEEAEGFWREKNGSNWMCSAVLVLCCGRPVGGWRCQGGGLTVSDQCRNLPKWGTASTQGGGLMPSEVDPILARYLLQKLWT